METSLAILHHVGLIVSDMDRSKAFYTKLLGREALGDNIISGPILWKQVQLDDAELRVVFIPFDNGGAGLELIEFRNKKGAQAISAQNTTATYHFALKASNVKELYERMNEDGYAFVAEPELMDERYGAIRGFTFGYLRGPDNELIEIIQNPAEAEPILATE